MNVQLGSDIISKRVDVQIQQRVYFYLLLSDSQSEVLEKKRWEFLRRHLQSQCTAMLKMGVGLLETDLEIDISGTGCVWMPICSHWQAASATLGSREGSKSLFSFRFFRRSRINSF